MGRETAAVWTLVLVLAGACGDDDVVGTDGGGLDGGDGGAVVAGPDIPWLVSGVPPLEIAPCPEGWREVTADGVTWCDPYPEGGALDCAGGEMHFPGEAGCAPVGAACPAGDFAPDLPTDRRVVHVQPGAMGGDGSLAMPYGGLTEFAAGGLPMGSVIALSRGTHDATVRLARSHVLWGACAADTTLSTTELSETDAVVLMRGTSGEIRNLTIADSPRPGVLVSGMGAEATLEGVVASSLQIAALVVAADARLVLRTVVARDTRSRGDFSLGRGLNCELAATLDARRVVVERNRDFGVYAALADTTLVLSDAVIRDTDGRATDDRTGRGLGVELGAIADVDRTLLERNRDVAIFASESDTRLMLDHVVVRDTQPRRGDGGAGQALAVQRGATGTLRRGLFERSFDVGVVVTEPGAALTASDLVVRDTAESMLDGAGGRSFDAQGAAVVDVSRALFERAVEVNVLVMEPDTASSLTDVAILDTESRADGIGGRGLGVQFGATVDANRLVVRDSRELGLSMSSPGSALAATNVVVRGVRVNGCADTTCPDQSYGFGVAVNREASFQLSDFIVADADVCGLHLALQGEGDLERGEVSGHPIGVCLQVDPYDSSRLTTGVRYLDNETNLQATSLPVPEPLVMVP